MKSGGTFSKDTFFNKVPVSERRKILHELFKLKELLMCKSHGVKFYIQLYEMTGVQNFVAALAEGVPPPGVSPVVTVTFRFENNLYFFVTPMDFQESKIITFTQDVDLFILQRRKNIRIDIPMEYPAFIELSLLEGRDISIKLRIVDMSIGGAKLQLEGESLDVKSGDAFKGVAKLGARSPIDIQGNVKFARAIPDKEGVFQWGVQFKSSSVFEKKMMTTLLNVQTELYKKHLLKKK